LIEMVINGINALLSLCFEGLVRRRAGAGVAQDHTPLRATKEEIRQLLHMVFAAKEILTAVISPA
jgi:hypothetical protein